MTLYFADLLQRKVKDDKGQDLYCVETYEGLSMNEILERYPGIDFGPTSDLDKRKEWMYFININKLVELEMINGCLEPKSW